MAGVKISALPVATHPLSGNELVPIVQSGVTKRTTVNDAGGNAVNTKFTPAGTISATNVQDALVEVAQEATAGGTAAGTSFVPTGTISATNVQDALVEVAAEAAASGVASGTGFTPSGNISATNVQAAIQELDSEKVAKAGDTMTGALLGPSYAGDRVQVGRNPTAANNFTLDATGNGGALWFYRGNTGFPIGASVFTINPNDSVTFRTTIDGPLGGFDQVQIGRSLTTTNNFYFDNNGSARTLKLARGNAGAGTQSVITIDASGNATFVADVTAFSDERLKTNWQTYEQDFIDRLAAVKSGTFERVHTGQRQVGVSAQSLQDLMPEAVHTGEDGFLSVAYGNAALAACVELAKEVKVLRARLEQVEGML